MTFIAEAAAVKSIAKRIAALTERIASGAASVRISQHFIVFGPLFFVGKRFVGTVDFYRTFGCVRFFADIGVVFAHQFSVGFFDFGLIRIFGNAQYFIIVFFCHVIPLTANIQNPYGVNN